MRRGIGKMRGGGRIIFQLIWQILNPMTLNFFAVRFYSDCHRVQKRLVSKVLLDGLYDPDTPLSKLLSVNKDIIWKEMLTTKWEFYPDDQ